MSTKDTTGDKLVASIRKTKSDKAPETKPASAPAAQASKKKVASKAAATKKKTAVAKKPQTTKQQIVNSFKFGQRVWPD